MKRIFTTKAAVAVSNAQTRERMKLKEMFEEAYERCRTSPYEGVAFTVDDFHSAIEKYDYNSEIGTKVLVRSPMLLPPNGELLTEFEP